MMYLLYGLIAVAATTIGAATGMGGGVFMKPILDVLGHYDVASISMLSTATVFVMAAVSVFRQRSTAEKPPARVAVPLAVGAAAGGALGARLLRAILVGMSGAGVTVIQNVCLAVLIVFVMLYMHNKNRIPSPALGGATAATLTGLFLGVCSSFLGIGGGPINVALIILLFDYGTKQAALCSLITILFSQGTKLVQTALTTGFSGFSLEILPVMVLGGILGGLLGAHIVRGANDKTTDRLFQGAQVLILALCIVNIARNLL